MIDPRDRYPFDRTVAREPGTTFGNLGVGPDTVVVPETRTYHSADKTIARRYRAGDVVTAQEATLLGIVPAVVGEPVPADELSVEAAIAFLRGRGYQVSPMAVTGPMEAPIPDEALIAHVQSEGFEVQRPDDALPELEQAVIAPGEPLTLTDGERSVSSSVTIDGEPVVGTIEAFDPEPEAKAEKPARNKAEDAPANKAEKAPRAKS